MYVYTACSAPKRSVCPLELELEVVVTHHVRAGDGTWVLSKSSPNVWVLMAVFGLCGTSMVCILSLKGRDGRRERGTS